MNLVLHNLNYTKLFLNIKTLRDLYAAQLLQEKHNSELLSKSTETLKTMLEDRI